MLLAEFSMLSPLFAVLVFFALPTELNSFLLHSACDEGTANNHSGFGLTASTFASAFYMIVWTEPARETADSNLREFDLHGYLLPFLSSF